MAVSELNWSQKYFYGKCMMLKKLLQLHICAIMFKEIYNSYETYDVMHSIALWWRRFKKEQFPKTVNKFSNGHVPLIFNSFSENYTGIHSTKYKV